MQPLKNDFEIIQSSQTYPGLGRFLDILLLNKICKCSNIRFTRTYECISIIRIV